MLIESSEAVWERILRERERHPEGVLAFDGDGTLWSGDLGDELFAALLDGDVFLEQAIERMRSDASAHGVELEGSGLAMARALEDAFKERRFPEQRMFEIAACAQAGHERAEIERFAAWVVEQTGVATRLHPEVVGIAQRARAAGIASYVVSASPWAMVVAAAALVGIGEVHVVAARALYEGSVMLPDVERPIPYAAGKVRRLHEATGGRPLLAAFGDSAFDAAMLSAAHVAVAVRPKQELRARSAEVPGLVELSRPDSA